MDRPAHKTGAEAGRDALSGVRSKALGGPAPAILADARRVVVKVGSALLTDSLHSEADRSWVEAVARDIARWTQTGHAVLVVSSGAVALGRRRLNLPARRRLLLEEKQAAAAAGQSLLMRAGPGGSGATDHVQICGAGDRADARVRVPLHGAEMGAILRQGGVKSPHRGDFLCGGLAGADRCGLRRGQFEPFEDAAVALSPDRLSNEPAALAGARALVGLLLLVCLIPPSANGAERLLVT